MKIGPKYKIARRLGAPIFEKTQTQKYALSLARKDKTKKRRGRGQMTDYGKQMLEKQKARLSYWLSEKQFANYVSKALAQKGNTVDTLYSMLESRLDNTVYRIGLAPTRGAARQMVSHGHIDVNGKRVNIPSFAVKAGDKVSIRAGSLAKPLFAELDERLKDRSVPPWIKFNQAKKEAEIQGLPKLDAGEAVFDLNAVLEFYSR